MKAHSKKIAAFAKKVLARQPLYLDTETTGMDKQAEVIDIAILDSDGSVLLDSLVKPQTSVLWQAEQVHGIDDDMLRHAPALDDIWGEIETLLGTERPLVIYNSAFDLRLLAQSAKKYGIFPRRPEEVHCAMLMYAEFHGEWNDYHETYVWQRLEEAVRQCKIKLPEGIRLHRAVSDCEATRLIMQYMAKKAGKK